MSNFVLCGIAMVCFPDDVVMRAEICRNVQCDGTYKYLRYTFVHFVGLVS
jgi:hypothetical protein